MRWLFADFETYFSDEFTLRKMTPAEYILDPRFESLGCAFLWAGSNSGTPFWVDGPDLQAWFAGQDWSDVAIVTHNALFDACILAWHYGVEPKLWVDTMSMSRALVQHEIKDNRPNALGTLAKHHGLSAKHDVYANFKGYRYAALKADAVLYSKVVGLALQDVALTAQIFDIMKPSFPPAEFVVVDNLIRCVVDPQLQLDAGVLYQHLQMVQQRKQALLDRVIVGTDVLMSNDKFAGALMALGVEPPRKRSLTTGKETWAFAKTDPDFKALLDHDDENVQVLAAARLGVKSTLEETRTSRLIKLATMAWADGEPWLPIPLRYSGAHTHRLSGDWSLNLQNLPRPKGDAATSLRASLVAALGMKIVVADLAQIEARVTAWLARQQDLLDAFAAGEDVYCLFASKVFGRKITKADKDERFLGKTAILGLGFGMGYPKFQLTVKNQSGRTLSNDDASMVVEVYRRTYQHIPVLWARGDGLMPPIMHGTYAELGPCSTRKDNILLPSGLTLRYHNLRQEIRTPPWEGAQPKLTWVYDWTRETKTLFGGKVIENIVQALARCLIMEAAIRIRRETGRCFAHLVHDELIYVVPEREAEDFKHYLVHQMTQVPAWAPGLPIAAEGGIGDDYASAK